jgi:hypothetical protein
MDNGEAVTWTGVAEAATRLGTSPAAIRKRIKRGTLEARRVNDGTYRVLLTSTTRHVPAPGRPLDTARPGQEPAPDGVALVERAARAEGECTALRAQVAELLARADRLEAALALARKGWLERVLEAVRR